MCQVHYRETSIGTLQTWSMWMNMTTDVGLVCLSSFPAKIVHCGCHHVCFGKGVEKIFQLIHFLWYVFGYVVSSYETPEMPQSTCTTISRGIAMEISLEYNLCIIQKLATCNRKVLVPRVEKEKHDRKPICLLFYTCLDHRLPVVQQRHSRATPLQNNWKPCYVSTVLP